MRMVWIVAVGLGIGVGASAAEPAGKVVRESWDAAYLDGEKAGHFHTTVVEVKRGEETELRVTRELRLTFKRNADLATLRASTGDDETPDGKLRGVFMSMDLARNQQMKLGGRVVDGVLKSSVEGPLGNKVKEIPLPDDILTYLTEESLLKRHQAKPGDRLTYRLFEPTVNNVIRVQVEVKGYEQVPLDGVNRKLLRAVAKPEKIAGFQLPSQTLWYDEHYQPVISESEVPGLGELTLRRTTRERALAQNGKLRDLGDQSVLLDRTIASPHQRNKIVYRVTFTKEYKDKDDERERLAEVLEKGFSAGDNRQSVQNAGGRTLELHITAQRVPPAKDPGALVPEQYLKSNYFINSDDELVRQHAAEAAGGIADPWKKAQAIERWVRSNMKAMAFTEAMATADHVARTLTGDCTEFAMLTAAMCRAQGVPSRTAIGLIYYNDRGQAKLGYHMWTEVFVRGEWLGLDATLGQGSVGPAHVKITDHGWQDVRSMTPLLPVMRLMMARPKMEVLRVE